MTFKEAWLKIIQNTWYRLTFNFWLRHDIQYRQLTPQSKRRQRIIAHELWLYDKSALYEDLETQINGMRRGGSGFGRAEDPVLVYEDPEGSRKFEVDYGPDEIDDFFAGGQIEGELTENDLIQSLDDRIDDIEDRTFADAFAKVGSAAVEAGEQLKTMATNFTTQGGMTFTTITSGTGYIQPANQQVGGVYPIQIYYSAQENRYRGNAVGSAESTEFIPLPANIPPMGFQGRKSAQLMAFTRTSDGRVLMTESQLVAMMEELGFAQVG